MVETLDLLDTTLGPLLNELPPAEKLARDGIEPEILETPSRVSKRVDPVQHGASRKSRHPFPSLRRRLEKRRAIAPPAESEKQAQLLTSPLQKVQVEIDDVPTDDDVGVDVL